MDEGVELHALIKSVWRKPKTGYNWIAAKYGPYWKFHCNIQEIIVCVTSKAYKVRCPIHQRVHDGRVHGKVKILLTKEQHMEEEKVKDEETTNEETDKVKEETEE